MTNHQNTMGGQEPGKKPSQPQSTSTSPQRTGESSPQSTQAQVGHAVDDMKQEVKARVGEATESVQAQAGEVIESVQAQAGEAIEGQKRAAADRLGNLAGALREAGHKFEDHDEGKLAQMTSGLAGELDHFAGRLRERELGMLLNDAKQLAQRQPEMFVTGALAAGFLLGRFLRSSGRRDLRDVQNEGYDYSSAYAPDFDREYDRLGTERGYGVRPTTDYGNYGSGYGTGTSRTPQGATPNPARPSGTSSVTPNVTSNDPSTGTYGKTSADTGDSTRTSPDSTHDRG